MPNHNCPNNYSQMVASLHIMDSIIFLLVLPTLRHSHYALEQSVCMKDIKKPASQSVSCKSSRSHIARSAKCQRTATAGCCGYWRWRGNDWVYMSSVQALLVIRFSSSDNERGTLKFYSHIATDCGPRN